MIIHFRHRGLRRLYERDDPSGVPPQNLRKIRALLRQLDTAVGPQDMDISGLRLHPLKGDLGGHWAVDVSGNLRMTFRFEGEDARDVDLLDYHYNGDWSETMPMKNPPHPGETVLVLCFEPFDLSIAEAAAHLKVNEEYLDALCEGRERITADLAVRLEQAFGSTAEAWLRLQTTHDLELARRSTCDVKPFEPAA